MVSFLTGMELLREPGPATDKICDYYEPFCYTSLFSGIKGTAGHGSGRRVVAGGYFSDPYFGKAQAPAGVSATYTNVSPPTGGLGEAGMPFLAFHRSLAAQERH